MNLQVTDTDRAVVKMGALSTTAAEQLLHFDSGSSEGVRVGAGPPAAGFTE